MKAFMSSAADKGNNCWPGCDIEATAELKRILAETEPWGCVNNYITIRKTRKALAEALENFLKG